MEGELREVSVLVCEWPGQDAAGAELTPKDWVALQNQVARMITDVTQPAGGYLDQMNGTLSRVVFGAPVRREDHGRVACESALEILRRVEIFNDGLVAKNQPRVDCRRCTGHQVG